MIANTDHIGLGTLCLMTCLGLGLVIFFITRKCLNPGSITLTLDTTNRTCPYRRDNTLVKDTLDIVRGRWVTRHWARSIPRCWFLLSVDGGNCCAATNYTISCDHLMKQRLRCPPTINSLIRKQNDWRRCWVSMAALAVAPRQLHHLLFLPLIVVVDEKRWRDTCKFHRHRLIPLVILLKCLEQTNTSKMYTLLKQSTTTLVPFPSQISIWILYCIVRSAILVQ